MNDKNPPSGRDYEDKLRDYFDKKMNKEERFSFMEETSSNPDFLEKFKAEKLLRALRTRETRPEIWEENKATIEAAKALTSKKKGSKTWAYVGAAAFGVLLSLGIVFGNRNSDNNIPITIPLEQIAQHYDFKVNTNGNEILDSLQTLYRADDWDTLITEGEIALKNPTLEGSNKISVLNWLAVAYSFSGNINSIKTANKYFKETREHLLFQNKQEVFDFFEGLNLIQLNETSTGLPIIESLEQSSDEWIEKRVKIILENSANI